MEQLDILIEKAKKGESSLLIELENNQKLSYKITELENNKIISIYEKEKKFPNGIAEMEFDKEGNLITPIIGTNKHIFVLYNRLSIEEKVHLYDFSIINAIRSSTEKKLTQDEQESLFSIIDNVSRNEFNETDPCRIADEITKAYVNKEISLEALQNSNDVDILDCIVGIGVFELLEEEYREGEIVE